MKAMQLGFGRGTDSIDRATWDIMAPHPRCLPLVPIFQFHSTLGIVFDLALLCIPLSLVISTMTLNFTAFKVVLVFAVGQYAYRTKHHYPRPHHCMLEKLTLLDKVSFP